MKKNLTLLTATIFAALCTNAQNIFPATGSAGIGTTAPDISSILEMVSTTKGLLIPRMTKTQRDAIATTPPTGLMIYQTNNTPGFYYYSGSAWTAVTPAAGANKTLNNLISPTAINQSLQPGTTGTIDIGSSNSLWRNAWFSGDASINGLTVGAGGGAVVFNTAIGASALLSNTSGTSNSAVGFNTLRNNTTGYYNTASGSGAMASNTTGYFNTAHGAASLFSNTTGIYNSATGYLALYSNTTGNNNTANGSYALYSNNTGYNNTANGYYALYSNTSGYNNTTSGFYALNGNTTGSSNTAAGFEALRKNTTGYSNIAIGSGTLFNNIQGHNLVAIGDSALYNQSIDPSNYYSNTAVGSKALYSNTTGSNNSATGYHALYANTTGFTNTANGTEALYANTTGTYNSAIGFEALYSNTTGTSNTACGHLALYLNTTGSCNSATGMHALLSNTTGSYNSATGYGALSSNTTGYDNTAIGTGALSMWGTGFQNTAIGTYSDANANGLNNATAIGYAAYVSANNSVQLGNINVTSVKAGSNIVIVSDGRFKKNTKENVPGLDFINQLKPVTYNYDIHKLNNYIKPALNAATEKSKPEKPASPEFEKIEEDAIAAKEKKTYTGFIAQDVEEIADKMGYDFSGVYKPQNDKDPYGLSYADFVVPLVKAVQELSKINSDKDNKITALEKQN
ncbi:MAG TPA: tail fiber domain-containing protein, partial [Panacibacter sp.]|nr:tail fiber domain-containing protein [Panacibacter sp.]